VAHGNLLLPVAKFVQQDSLMIKKARRVWNLAGFCLGNGF